MNASCGGPIYYLLITISTQHLTMKPDAVTDEKIHNKNLRETLKYTIEHPQQLTSGKHDHPTSNIMGIILCTTMTNTNNF
jgi:hypothetical protein